MRACVTSWQVVNVGALLWPAQPGDAVERRHVLEQLHADRQCPEAQQLRQLLRQLAQRLGAGNGSVGHGGTPLYASIRSAPALSTAARRRAHMLRAEAHADDPRRDAAQRREAADEPQRQRQAERAAAGEHAAR